MGANGVPAELLEKLLRAGPEASEELTDLLARFGVTSDQNKEGTTEQQGDSGRVASREEDAGIQEYHEAPGAESNYSAQSGDYQPETNQRTAASASWPEDNEPAPVDAFDAWGANSVGDGQSSQQTSRPPAQEREKFAPNPDRKPLTDEEALLHFPHDIVEVKLADQQADVNSPLYSIRSFDKLGLKDEVLKGVYAMKFTKPSKIQERALPLLLADPPRNMIGQSQSGTGKTAAFALSMLSRVDFDLDEVQAICLAPTRELARQIMDVTREMSQFTNVKLAFAIRENERSSGIIKAQIVIGTPGSVMGGLQRRKIDPTYIKMYVLDEADSMLDMQGHGDQCSRIRKFLPPTCQHVLFSATFPDAVRQFAQTFAPEANEISLKQQELSIDAIKQFYLDCADNNERDSMLIDLYGLMTIGQSIIFVNTKRAADRIADFMTREGHHVIALHGSQELEERDRMIDSFRTGKAKVMVTTNVVARGIDISQVNLVINYDMPFDADGRPDCETYLHRIGRTGRFGRSGVAINLVSNPHAYDAMIAMEKHFGQPVAKLEMTDYEATERILKKALK